MKTLVAVVLSFLVAGSAAPGAVATPTGVPSRTSVLAHSTTPNASPSTGIVFVCPPIYCSDDSKGAVLKAVAGLTYPVKTVRIGLFGLSCGEPFP